MSLEIIFGRGFPFALIFFLSILKNSLEVGFHESSHGFCYPNTKCWESATDDQKNWPGMCQRGHHQSPISLPVAKRPTGKYHINIPPNIYKWNTVYVSNNGHTVILRTGSTTQEAGRSHSADVTLTAESGKDKKEVKYAFYRAHFHWGENNTVGSEHTIGNKRFALEMHMVHYNTKYASFEEAVKSSKDKTALMVIGILFEAKDNNPDYRPLKFFRNHMPNTYQPEQKEIETKMDLHTMMPHPGAAFYKYLGSLTTPPCDEIVLWAIFSKPIQISTKDAAMFRKIKDANGLKLNRNFRDTQPGHGRPVNFVKLAK